MGTRVNPDTIGCVRTGEFDLNTLRVDGEIFESGKKTLRIQKYPDTCGRGLSDLPLSARLCDCVENALSELCRTPNYCNDNYG